MFTTEEQNVIDEAIKIIESKFKSNGVQFNSSKAVKDFFRLEIASSPYEIFGVLFLNTKHEFIAFEEMFKGTINSAAVYPREVVRAAINHNAAAIIFTHNHPSGDTVPSDSDIEITERLKDALNLIEVRVLDHIVVSETSTYSFAEHGLL